VSQRWALLLQYDGTEFAGSQWQPNRPTVQGALQTALQELTGAQSLVSLAGRTDAGVHATGQVASFVTDKSIESMSGPRWVRGLNHFLPTTVAVQAATPVTMEFDPRRDAVSRSYQYEVFVANQRQPLRERRTWIVPPPFDHDQAQAALTALLGRHDFAAFTPPTDERSTLRSMCEASAGSSGPEIRFQFRADAFLQHQVRRMVGAAVDVARGRQTLTDFHTAFARAKPGSMGPTAPACGLTLVEVGYPQPLFNYRPLSGSPCHRDREGD